MVNTFVFMGLPGAGKGKQSEMLSEKLGYKISSTGDEFREIARRGGTLGEKVNEVMMAGDNMPAWFAIHVFQKTLLETPKENGLIFEGVGRKEPEAKNFAEVCEWIGRDFAIICLNVDEAIAKERLIKRGRADDVHETISSRIANFYKDTQPAIDYFRSIGKVIEIDGNPLPEPVFAEVCEKLGIK